MSISKDNGLQSLLNFKNSLTNHLPENLSFEDEEDFLNWARERLPSVECRFSDCASLSILSFSLPSQNIQFLLLDLVRTWFLSESLELCSLDYTPIVLEKYPHQRLLRADFLIKISHNDFEKIQQSIPGFLKELRLCLSSPEHVETLFRLRASSPRQDFYFYERLIRIMDRWPDEFEKDLIQDYQHFIGLAEPSFQKHRSIRHQLRILCSLYLMRKKLLHKLLLSPQELHLDMRILPTRLHFPFSQKSVLGLAIAINIPSPYARFEDSHILLAVKKLIPWTQAIKESFLVFQKPHSSLRLLYLEIEKTNDAKFFPSEKTLLKQTLSTELKKSVETLSPSIFGNCDIEEVMRNIFVLSQEVQELSDIPQVMISFEGSSAKSLIFRIISVRLLKESSQPLQICFQTLNDSFEYIPERNSIIGYIGKIAKEATVFRLQISKTPFLLRSDSSFNLYRARQYVYSLLTKALGEIRDYNGGIFSKQIELFSQFRQHFIEQDPEFLEDFFHALNPAEMQAILPLTSISTLFGLFLQTLQEDLSKNKGYCLHIEEKDVFFYAAIRLQDNAFQEQLTHALIEAKLFQEITAWTIVKRYDGIILGYINRSSPEKNQLFSEILCQNLEKWVKEKQNTQVIRFNLQSFPVSLDPRLGGDEISGILLKMLFEGLMRVGKNSKPEFAIANDVVISEEGKRYIFTLRKCYWNNGDPVTAHDFCYAWKKILSPSFSTAFAYLLYDIKNAKKAKEGKVSLEEIGIEAYGENTLVVELEHPCSYFLELLANPLYSPVNHKIDRLYPNWPLQTSQAYICNGPFQLANAHSQEGYLLRKNPHYWDASAVRLTHIQVSRATAKKALEMFKKGEIDWLGRPFRPWEPFFSELGQPTEKLSSSVACWCSYNVQQFPFQSKKLRLALSYALDRQAIIDRLSLDRIPAFSPLPFFHAGHLMAQTKKDQERARILFEEALHELNLKSSKFPPLTFLHANNEVRKEIANAITQQWKEILGITVQAQACDFRELFSKTTSGNYQLSMIMWRTYIDDPLYTLNAFRHADDEINFPNWENTEYQQLLAQIEIEQDSHQKKHLLASAESILVREMPIIPICYEIECFARRNHIKGAYPTKFGNIDFKHVFISKDCTSDKENIFKNE